MLLSREDLDIYTSQCVDPTPDEVCRPAHNVDLTDRELVERINSRNGANKPTYLLRMEYERRLRQRGL